LLIAAAALTAMGPTLAIAGDDTFNPLGDGSDFNNSDLTRDPTTGCENCEPNPPHDFAAPWFDLDWSLALRGSYVRTTAGDYFEGTANPSVTLHHEFLRGSYEATASAEVSKSTVEDFRLGAFRTGFKGDYQIDESLSTAGELNFAWTRDSSRALGTDPTIALQPQVFSGDGEASLQRDFGPLVFTGTVNGARTVYGETTLVDTSTVDNSAQNNWRVSGSLRVGYRVTPIVTAFVEGTAGYQWYDVPSPSYLVKLDAADYQVRAGLSAEWNDVWKAEASVGYALRRFAEPSFGDTSALLYDASVTYRPDETVEINGEFTTSFDAPGPDSNGTARLEYAAQGDVAYLVNPWLKLRATAGWTYAQLVGTTDTERSYNLGAGADYVLNEFTTLTADYNYSNSESPPNPAEDAHRVTVGVTFHR
jgi:opacity protein-like surface antigen